MMRQSFRSPSRLGAAAACLVLAICAASVANALETLYLTNTKVVDDSGNLVTELYFLEIDGVAKTANAMLIDVLPFEKVDALACTPDDKSCFLIDKYHSRTNPTGGRWGRYDFETGVFTILGEVLDDLGELIPGVVLAGHSPGPQGQLFFGSQETESLYTIDKATGVTSNLGPVVVQGTSTTIDLNGADLVFTSDSRLFIWTNSARLPDAPSGLYEVFLPQSGGEIQALYLGTGDDGSDPASHFFTGLAVRENGLGDIVGSNRFDELHQQGRDGSDVDLLTLVKDGLPLGHAAGDMHHSFDCLIKIDLDRDEVAPGETLWATVRLIHNRPRTVETPLVMWIEDRSGNVLVERRSLPQRLGWGDSMIGTVPIRIPEAMPPGGYMIRVEMSEMRQGKATARNTFRVRLDA